MYRALLLLLLSSAGVARADFGVPISTVRPLNTNAAGDTGFDGSQYLATDSQGNWIAVWSSYNAIPGPGTTDRDIHFARTIDNGANWSNPLPLNANFATETASDEYPVIATDGKGNWVAVWSAVNSGGSLGTDVDILVARSIDNGANWSIPVPLNTNATTDSGDDYTPDIATDGQGHWVAVWRSGDTLGGTIGSDLDILVARSIDNGASWTSPAPLSSNAATDTGSDNSPRIVTDRKGNWLAAWASTNTLNASPPADNDIHFVRSIDNGEHWSLVAPLNTNAGSDSGTDSSVQLACDGQGNWVAAWSSNDSLGGTIGSDYDILLSRSSNNGASWSPPAPLNTDAAVDSDSDTIPSIATDRVGRWVVIWEGAGIGGPPSGDSDIRIARSIDNGANWSNPDRFNSNAANDMGEDANPFLVTDEKGSWLAIWETEDPDGQNLDDDGDILTQHFALPDCNDNLVADSTEVLLGLLPDINNNNVPDVCEVIDGPPPGQNGCGGGVCGVGMAPMVPLMLLGMGRMRRSRRSCNGVRDAGSWRRCE